MNLNPNDLPEHIRKLNPHLFVGAVGRPQPKQDAPRPLVCIKQARKKSETRLVVSMVRCSVRSLDDDNLSASFKPLRDAIATTLGIDDADPRVRWEYGQCETRGEVGTIVKIEEIGTSTTEPTEEHYRHD